MLPRNRRNRRHTLKALTDPQPEFVSLVFGGANKTPFRAMRTDGSAIGEEEVTEKTATHTIARVEFAGAKFADEATVKDWLTSGGYDADMAIKATDDGFIVDSDLDPAAVLDCIDMSDTQGVKIYTVAIRSDEDVLELTEKEMVHPGALDTDEPLVLDLLMSTYVDVRKHVVEGDYDGAKAVAGQLADKLDALTSRFPDSGEASFKAFVDAIAPEIEMSKENDPAIEETVDAVKTDETVDAVVEADAATAEKTDAVAEEIVTEAGAADAEVAAEKTDEVVADAADAVVEADAIVADEIVAEKTDEENSGEAAEAAEPDAIAALTALVSELTASVKSMQETVATDIEKVVERVAAVETTRQTRKGADVDETSTASTGEATVSKGIADLRTRSVLGMRPSASK